MRHNKRIGAEVVRWHSRPLQKLRKKKSEALIISEHKSRSSCSGVGRTVMFSIWPPGLPLHASASGAGSSPRVPGQWRGTCRGHSWPYSSRRRLGRCYWRAQTSTPYLEVVGGGGAHGAGRATRGRGWQRQSHHAKARTPPRIRPVAWTTLQAPPLSLRRAAGGASASVKECNSAATRSDDSPPATKHQLATPVHSDRGNQHGMLCI